MILGFFGLQKFELGVFLYTSIHSAAVPVGFGACGLYHEHFCSTHFAGRFAVMPRRYYGRAALLLTEAEKLQHHEWNRTATGLQMAPQSKISYHDNT